jgi:hypothetical protein
VISEGWLRTETGSQEPVSVEPVSLRSEGADGDIMFMLLAAPMRLTMMQRSESLRVSKLLVS